jgi:hypothetical protein
MFVVFRFDRERNRTIRALEGPWEESSVKLEFRQVRIARFAPLIVGTRLQAQGMRKGCSRAGEVAEVLGIRPEVIHEHGSVSSRQAGLIAGEIILRNKAFHDP